MLLLLAVILPVSIYMLLSVPAVQNYIRDVAARELSRTLGATVGVGEVSIHPFSRLSVNDISLSLGDDTIATVSAVSAGFEMYHFLRTGELVIDYALVEGVDVNISRSTSDSPLNIEPIIAHLRNDRRPKEDKAFELRIYTIVLRDAALGYDVLSEPIPEEGRFSPHHIEVKNLSLNADIPRLTNDQYHVHIDHLSFEERSGFSLKSLHAKAYFGRTGAGVDDLSIDLSGSHIALAPLEMSYTDYSDIMPTLRSQSFTIATKADTYIFPPDFKAFVPLLDDIDQTLEINVDAEGNLQAAELRTMSIRASGSGALSLSLSGRVCDIQNPDSMSFSLTRGLIHIDGPEATALFGSLMKPDIRKLLSKIPDFSCSLSGGGTLAAGDINMEATGTPGAIDFKGSYAVTSRHKARLTGSVVLDGFNLGLFTGNERFGGVSAKIDGFVATGRHPQADVKADVSRFTFGGYTYTGISADLAIALSGNAEINFALDDPNAHLLLYGFYNGDAGVHSLHGTAIASGINFNALGLDSQRPEHLFGAKLNVELDGNTPDDMSGLVSFTDIRWLDGDANGIKVDYININAAPRAQRPSLTIDSDILTGGIYGSYSFASIVPQLRTLAAEFMPALFEGENLKSAQEMSPNVFDYNFRFLPSRPITGFLRLPVHIITDVTVKGRVDSDAGRATIDLDAPYLVQGNRLLEKTHIFAALDASALSSNLYLTTSFPTKKGDMSVAATLRGADNRLDTHADWAIERAIPLNGTIDFSTLLRARPGKKDDATFPLDALISFHPGTINFGDEVWRIGASEIDVAPWRIDVRDFRLDAGSQSVAVSGSIGSLPSDSIIVSLNNVAIVPIFETLEIDKALISGRATGNISAHNLLGDDPDLHCPLLHVDSIGYQYCSIGDADIKALWSNERKAVYLDADITGFEGKKSRIYGDIYPMTEALDLNFEADSIPVGFLRPFMEAFTSSISGRAGGHCRLFGTFKEIDLEGDVKAEGVSMKVDFTGTTYSATDSVHMTPGKILLDNITIRDPEGHTARLNGVVNHKYFKEPSFRFDITDARDLLAYNTTARDNPDWYGTIYTNGSASIFGYPGVVNINVDMSTAPRSTFDFVLSDRLDAEEYSFITFRDKTPDSLKVNAVFVDNTPEAVKEFRRQTAADTSSTSQYNMDIRIGVTPDATVTLVMDPAAGDRIRAHGQGNLHMAYSSTNSDLNIWGKYTVADGSYRFTLQDIIIKDFIIKEGSEIQFDGDPYGVKTSLNAYYATNANLSDLDESFLQDKDVARTNVPVHAIMKVNGDIRQPDIDFDLEFPTLTSDTYRKVRSIVSTEDMMNRQIIYLLALNRFYTPDYMASTTKGSELFSVASSTISSQLGNMLGKLSDNWSIAPNLRSDRGDFSDVEVDVALSSRLLNNRLIFNGNFGYRDKSLNSNQFVGDFDIEYLLNKRGSWRLKAYNRYNDRNYYLRSAQTTQGVGIMFRRDFDSFLSFIKRSRKKAQPTDSVTAPTDSVK